MQIGVTGVFGVQGKQVFDGVRMEIIHEIYSRHLDLVALRMLCSHTATAG